MPLFQFEAMDAKGMEIRGTITAPTEAEAQTMIRKDGHFVTRISEKGKFVSPPLPQKVTWANKIGYWISSLTMCEKMLFSFCVVQFFAFSIVWNFRNTPEVVRPIMVEQSLQSNGDVTIVCPHCKQEFKSSVTVKTGSE